MSGTRLSESSQWRLFAAAWMVGAVIAVGVAGWVARRDAEASAMRQAETAAALHAAVLRSELERQRAVPYVLAADRDVRVLLATRTETQRDLLNHKLETLASEVRAAVIYVLDSEGMTLAASNWRDPVSFVGSDYGFRPYFVDAMRDGETAFFALGTVSGRPGLYLSRRIDDPSGRPLGVVVAKVEFDALEAAWRQSEEPTYVTDPDGVVLITTSPNWRFNATRPLSTERRRSLAEDQTAGATLNQFPFQAPERGLIRLGADVAPGHYAVAADNSAGLGWTLHLLWPAEQMLSRAVGAARVLALLSIALLAVLTGVLLRRRQRAHARTAYEEALRGQLERQVEARTVELSAANRSLSREMDERRRLEEVRQALQDELIQANKLATLGQIAAGVAHEINQPIAAIRTYADSAGLYLKRNDADSVGRSLASISDMTERVGTITDELRAFSRKSRGELVPVDVKEAIDGALLLVSARLRERNVRIQRDGDAPGVCVIAERIRLEQVILNLLQNAIEALQNTADPEVRLSVDLSDDRVVIKVRDNGPGLSTAVSERLFTPFTTDKPLGTGLGLVISRDIVAGFGGELTHEPSDGGAIFRIDLARSK